MNPSEMSDEELQQAIQPDEAPETPEEAPDEAPEEAPVAAEETPDAPAEVPEEPETPEEEPEQPAPSRREQLRIQQLLAKYGRPEDRPKPSQVKREDALDYAKALDADPEVIEQLEADRRRSGEAQYNEGLKRAEFLDWKTSLKIDAPVVEKKHPILDPNDKEHFHPGVADAINQWYLGMSGFDPQSQTVANNGISYAEFVDGFMELVQETAGQRNAQTVKNIVKQSATTGLRPDGSSAKRLDLTKDPGSMSTEELYAAIGQKPPKK